MLRNPFEPGEPHPLARQAAEALQEELARLPTPQREDAAAGKMFGVLVARDSAGHLTTLRAFAGMLGGRWDVDGFVGPVFDLVARNAWWPAAERELRELDEAIDAPSKRASALCTQLEALAHSHAAAERDSKSRDEALRAERHAQRTALGGAPETDETRAALARLSNESQRARDARRAEKAAHLAERESILKSIREQEVARDALKRQRAARSNEFLEALLAGYQLCNARGEVRSVKEIFAPEAPPGGAGDCAAPKLFAHAQRNALQPIALAEFWWGASPVSGTRRHGAYYPSCRSKCGPVLAHVLQGWDVESFAIPGAAPIAPDEPRTLYEDRWLAVVDKPEGLLSVPGRHHALRDCVLARLRARYPDATGPIIVHRLDLDTSGVMVVAKDLRTYQELQRQFAKREVEKRYVAIVEGDVAGGQGAIDLPLRVDLDDRPRQMHDPIHGKAALTTWAVLAREKGRTRLALRPHTGRTHQLRVHAAHPLGLNAPIVGDRLYGTAAERLHLHAERVRFVNPGNGSTLELESPTPF
ncbi:MAG: RluA family pseudouridine synthase [Deltaproteobacteria bacterium]|nr:RluA family pseudouridine synthase [Deltaproteobacteria bacterium]